MILDSAGSLTQTNCALKSKEFTIKASPIAFDILSSRLYANPVLAIVRELLTNAYDSHKAAGKEDVPIKVTLPSYLETNFIIRDFGLGLSEKDITQMYTTFFDSTKSNTNDFTGCFGLGSKTPFSYTSSFSVNSYFNGTKYRFIAVKKDGYPSIIKVGEEETTEPNGLEISIPTDKTNGIDYSFRTNLEKYLQFIPEIKIDCNTTISRATATTTAENVTFYYSNEYNRRNRVLIKQGQNVYDANEDFDQIVYRTTSYIQEICRGFNIVIEVPIGTVGITPSREHLANDDTNTAIITKILEDADNVAKCMIINKNYTQLGSAGNAWLFQRAYHDIMTKKYLHANPLIKATFITHSGSDTNSACSPRFGCGSLFRYSFNSDKISHSAAEIQENQKTLIILCPSKPTGKILTKIKNIMNNYSNLSDYDVLFMTFDWNHGYYHSYCEKSLLRSVKTFEDMCWILNNIPEFDFDVETITLNKFRKQYPNDRKARTTKPKVTAIAIRKTAYTMYTTVDASYNRCYGFNSTSLLSNVLNKYPKETTFLLPCVGTYEKHKIFDPCINTLNILCKTDYEFIREYLKKALDVTTLPETVYFLSVAKSSLKYFEDYKTLDIDDVKKHISDYGWKYRFTGSSYFKNDENELIEMLDGFDERILNCYKPHVQQIIKNSSHYKKLTSIKNIINKYMLTNALSSQQEDFIAEFIGHEVTKTKRIANVIRNTIKRYLPEDFLFFCKHATHRYYNHRIGEYEWRLRQPYRHSIFNIIKKGGKECSTF